MAPDVEEKILRAGGNLITNRKAPEVMIRLARAAKEIGTHVTFVGGGAPDVLLSVIAAGGKHVTFDVAEYPVKT